MQRGRQANEVAAVLNRERTCGYVPHTSRFRGRDPLHLGGTHGESVEATALISRCLVGSGARGGQCERQAVGSNGRRGDAESHAQHLRPGWPRRHRAGPAGHRESVIGNSATASTTRSPRSTTRRSSRASQPVTSRISCTWAADSASAHTPPAARSSRSETASARRTSTEDVSPGRAGTGHVQGPALRAAGVHEPDHDDRQQRRRA